MFRLRLLGPAVARHLAAYAALGQTALSEWRHGFERQAVLLVASALLAMSGLLVGCGWLLYSVRNRPERHFVALGLIILLAGIPVYLYWSRARRRSSLPSNSNPNL